MNALDWTLQDAKTKYELLSDYNIPVWVMEPLRGGKLAGLSTDNEAKLKKMRPDDSIASWNFRWLMAKENVTVILSGMSDMEQMQDNIKTFESGSLLNENETQMLENIVDDMKNSLPCTGCRYCCDGCPRKLDIPMLIAAYNDVRFEPDHAMTVSMQMDALSADELPSACIGCGACSSICPQNIDIPNVMTEFSEMIAKLPKWTDICKKRVAEQPE